MGQSSGPDLVRVLIVEDNPDDAQLEIEELQRSGLRVSATVVDGEADFTAALAGKPDLILCDRTLPHFSAARVFEIAHDRRLPTPVVVVSGTVTDSEAVEFMRLGACDYVLKDRLARLGPAVKNCLERIQWEREAAEASSRLVRVMTDLEVGAATSDFNGNLLSCNDVLWRMFGYESRAQFAARPTSAHYVDPNQRADMVERLSREGRVRGYDVEFKRADGSTFWATCEFRAAVDDSGTRPVIDSLMIDSTERKGAERERHTNQERLDSAMSNAPIVLASVDRLGRCTFAGGAGLDLVGMDPKLVIGREIGEIFADRPDIIASVKRAIAGEELTRDAPFRGRYLHVKYHPLGTKLGGGAAMVAVDITERHEAECKAEARARQQSAARDLAHEALNSPPISQLMNKAVELAAAAVGVEMSAVHQLDTREGFMQKLASTGYRAPDAKVEVAGDDLIDWLVRHSDSRAVDDYLTDELPRSRTLAREGVRAILAVGIRDEENTFGILSVSSRSPHKWTDDEREFVDLMGRTLWVAVQGQRLEQQRRRLMTRLVDAQEQERRRIAADVHDDAVQVMSAVTMRLHLLAQRLTDPAQLSAMAKLQSNVSLSIERLRHLLFELSPPALERHTLAESLQTMVDGFQRDFGVVTVLSTDMANEPDPASGLVVYRVVQEALINVHKHSHAKHVNVEVKAANDGVLGCIQDDGIGFDPATAGNAAGFGHMGLTSMRERAELAGGWWKLESARNRGTRVEFWVPCASQKPAVA